jgi:hypothetical protein
MVSDGEGRGVTDTWQDIPTSDRPTGHPSSWEAEAKELRDELAKERATLSLIKSVWASTVEGNEALRERVAELEALVETAYIEGWQHGAVEYGGRVPHVISAAAQKDWRELSVARAALQTGLQCDEGTMGGNGS